MVISTKALGRKKAPLQEWEYQPPREVLDPGDGGLTLRQLLERIVREEVARFHSRQRDKTLVHLLSSEQIRRAAEAGKVTMGLQEFEHKVDPEQAVGAALLAFEDGLYLVFIDDEEQRELDSQVFIHADSRLVFLPLTFLSGV